MDEQKHVKRKDVDWETHTHRAARPPPPPVVQFQALLRQVKAANPDASLSELSMILDEEWRGLSDELKWPHIQASLDAMSTDDEAGDGDGAPGAAPPAAGGDEEAGDEEEGDEEEGDEVAGDAGDARRAMRAIRGAPSGVPPLVQEAPPLPPRAEREGEAAPTSGDREAQGGGGGGRRCGGRRRRRRCGGGRGGGRQQHPCSHAPRRAPSASASLPALAVAVGGQDVVARDRPPVNPHPHATCALWPHGTPCMPLCVSNGVWCVVCAEGVSTV